MIVRSHFRRTKNGIRYVRSHARVKSYAQILGDEKSARRKRRVKRVLGAAAVAGGALAYAKRKKLADLLRPIKGNSKAGLKKFSKAYHADIKDYSVSDLLRFKPVVG